MPENTDFSAERVIAGELKYVYVFCRTSGKRRLCLAESSWISTIRSTVWRSGFCL